MFRIIVAAATLVVGTMAAIPAASAQDNLVTCAQEHGYCRVPYPTRVYYGIPGRMTSLDVGDRGIRCSNDVFGDPAPGSFKHCAYEVLGDDPNDPGDPPSWRNCARENEFCDFRGRKRVRYGARDRFYEGTYRDGVDCDNATFGDPLVGVVKFCQILD